MTYIRQSDAKALIIQAFKNVGKENVDFAMRHKQGQCQIVVRKNGRNGVVASGEDWAHCLTCLVNGLKLLKAEKAGKIIKVGPASGKTTTKVK